MKKLIIGLSLLSLSVVASAAVEKRYVTDTLWLQLRSGPSMEYRILKQLVSGENLIFISDDPATGYTKVKTDKGVEGFVLTRFLETEPVAKEKLVLAERKLEKLEAELAETIQQRNELKAESAKLKTERSGLSRNNTDLEKELTHLKEISASAVELDEKNRQLLEQNRELEIQVKTLSTENTQLHDGRQQTYILYGGGLVFAGIIAGLILPSLRGKRGGSNWA
ncbi:MAG: TIGR04211 family SH3 domain-containing protein [Venatoribacter sp.]